MDELVLEVRSLNTRLLETVAARDALEAEVVALRRSEESARTARDAAQAKLEDALRLRDEAEVKADRLSREILELTESLMNEANIKVSQANRSSAEAKQASDQQVARLRSQLRDRDALIESQQQQLAMLRAIIEGRSEELKPANGVQLAEEVARVTAVPAADAASRSSISLNICAQDTPVSGLANESDFRLAEEYANALFNPPVSPHVRFDLPEFRDFLALGQPLETPASRVAAWGARASSAKPPKLSQYKFAQRTLECELEPTLQLDASAHLNWLLSRAWLNAVVEGTLVIEPVPPAERVWAQRPSNPCALCGCTSELPQHARFHRAVVGDNTYPLGSECVPRVRAACEYATFLRAVRDGVRRVDTSQGAASAWCECLRLREQMLLSRSGAFYPRAHRGSADSAAAAASAATISSSTARAAGSARKSAVPPSASARTSSASAQEGARERPDSDADVTDSAGALSPELGREPKNEPSSEPDRKPPRDSRSSTSSQNLRPEIDAHA